MKRTVQLLFLVLSILLVGCTKEEDVQSTTFEGAVRLGSREVSFSEVGLEIFGRANEYGCFLFCEGVTKYNKVFPVESDGSFSIPVTTEEVEYFWLGLRINGERVSSDCAPLSQCTDLNPGKDFTGLLITIVD